MLNHEEMINCDPLNFQPGFSDQTVGVNLCLISNSGGAPFVETWTADEKRTYILPKPVSKDDPLVEGYHALSVRYIRELRCCSALTELTIVGCVLDIDLMETLAVVLTPKLRIFRLENIKYNICLLPFLPIAVPRDATGTDIVMDSENTVRMIQSWAGHNRWTLTFAAPGPEDITSAKTYLKLSNTIFKELRHCSALRELTISGRMIDKRLLETINHLCDQNLTSLTLNDVKQNKVLNLALQLPGYMPPKLISLTLDSNDWKWTGFAIEYQHSVLGLFHPNSLETLNMTGTWYVPFAYQFMGFIGGCPRLTHLSTVLTFDAITQFSFFLGQCPALKVLTVNHTPRVPLVHEMDFAGFNPSVCPNLEELNVPAALLPHFYPLNEMRPRLETVTISDPYAVSYEHEAETQKRLMTALDDPRYQGNQTVKHLHVGTLSSTWKELRVILRRIYEMFDVLESLNVWTYDTELSNLNGRKLTKSLAQLENAITDKNTYEAVLLDITPGIIDLPPTLVELTIINHSPKEMDDEVEEAFLRCLNTFQDSPSLASHDMMMYTPLLRAVCAFSIFAGVLGTVNVTSPNSNTTLSAGVVSRVTWKDNGKAPSLKDFGLATISLCTGTSEKQVRLHRFPIGEYAQRLKYIHKTFLQTFASKINISAQSSAEFTVDSKVGPNSDTYLIRFVSSDSKNVAFSQNFKLTNMTGAFPTSSGTKSSTATSNSSSTITVTDTLTAPPSLPTGTTITGNSTDGLNSTITASDGNATMTLPAPCPGCVNITVVVLVTTAHDSPTPAPTRSDALSIVRGLSLGRLGAFAAVFVVPFALLA
ncbi:hypothetical protein D9619_005175 [Psilocybe cf. subviscida]|uniref:Uncharacterized protein n=1 Tax=Psilocybe cf. subviscida TaxID=2480587 RepID=A0A8H5FC32_9AGAR|nr:hypothetical protein D9619_005175 [Psilocybe cf. subviscida]